jgi:hypothetical protein
MDPTFGSAGTVLKVWGSRLSDVKSLRFIAGGVEKGSCTAASSATTVSCTAPPLPSGAYTVVLSKALPPDSGELSVDPRDAGAFTYVATITGVSGNVGSLGGGLPLTLSVGGAGPDMGALSSSSNNVVSVGGLPCPITSVQSAGNAWTVVCTAPAAVGYVQAEYWNLPAGLRGMPELQTWTNPRESDRRSVGIGRRGNPLFPELPCCAAR